ncbi:putative HTH-type transcriptional regulator YbbH [Aquimixticola soesokkakensis]|uniref:Putative HTH-type transcriptional regulator YbbH n=1 Tax=Aquimixticola soesokkakensis TaxID=1519096 RepID=A0A1Y5T3T4_9RHOB|nr:MurR/RpiR family transcriptional regulator [Aquimixticola soesokkakensis]SLN55157.1 putative HTH-type transcriptional regulator YbbH [Aquimixticola soesokkakensis]
MDQAHYGLPAQTLVARKIQQAYPELTTAQRRFAELVRSAPLRVARLSIHDAVSLVGVSVATANRFATTLGFEGYADFKNELIRGFEQLFAPLDRFERDLAEHDEPVGVMRTALASDVASLQRTSGALSAQDLDAAVTMITGAARIHIAGFDLAAHLGGIFAIELAMVGCRASSATNGGGSIGAIRDIFDFGPQDLVIAIAFPHYYTDTLRITQWARGAGIPVLAITDTMASPLAAMAQTSLFVPPAPDGQSASSTVILGLLEGLKAAVAMRKPDATEAGRRFSEAAYPWMTAGEKGWASRD